MADEIIKIIDKRPADFRKNMLPSNSDVIKAIYLKHFEDRVSYKVACEHIAWCVATIWERVSIPVVQIRAIERRVERFFEEFYKLTTCDTTRSKSISKIDDFNVSFSKIYFSNVGKNMAIVIGSVHPSNTSQKSMLCVVLCLCVQCFFFTFLRA